MKAYESKPDVLGGTPCFTGTRVPVKSLFDWLEEGYTIDEFLGQFPSVKREQAQSVLEETGRQIDAQRFRAAG